MSRYTIMCTVEGGVTGHRKSRLKTNGEVRVFEHLSEARAVAEHLTRARVVAENRKRDLATTASAARFSYEVNSHYASLYTIEIDQALILITDTGGSLSVTNDAEAVIADLLQAHPLEAKVLRIIYRDSDGRWDGMAVADGVFAGFVSIGATSRDSAIDKALSMEEWSI